MVNEYDPLLDDPLVGDPLLDDHLGDPGMTRLEAEAAWGRTGAVYSPTPAEQAWGRTGGFE